MVGFFFQTLVSLKDDGSLIQEQEWDGKKTTITRKLVDGQLVVVSSVPLSGPQVLLVGSLKCNSNRWIFPLLICSER